MIKFDCGCSFEDKDGHPIISYDLNKINFNCPIIWDLISAGRTIGLFQIDSGLGQQLSKRLKPQNIDHLAALTAIMRPSCMRGLMEDGKSITDHYIDRKNGVEESRSQYEALEPILKNTYNLMIFQEQAIQIGNEIAGMSLQDSDHYIRYGIGKKKSDIIAAGKQIFLDGCKKIGKVNEKEAEEIWQWIESAQRYQFNAAHSYGYAFTSYMTAIPKAHTPLRFFKSYLDHSTDKPHPLEEVKHLVNDARSFNIDIVNPDLRLKNPKFLIKDGRIHFGLSYIKGVGNAATKALIRLIERSEEKTDLDHISWPSMLLETLLDANKTTVKNSIAVGCLDYLKIPREQMLFEHDTILKFTEKEISWIKNNLDLSKFSNLESILTEILSKETGKGQPISNKNRKNILKGLHFALVKSPYKCKDTYRRLSILETSYLGVSLSCHKTDEIEQDLADTTVKEFQDGKTGDMKLIVIITKIKEIVTKKGENMAFLGVEDASGAADNIVAFPMIWSKNKSILFEGNSVLLAGKSTQQGSFSILGCKGI